MKTLDKVITANDLIRRLEGLPNSSDQEILNDNTCIICRDKMEQITQLKKLQCKHVFHTKCLKRWIQRQQTCPICRNVILINRE